MSLKKFKMAFAGGVKLRDTTVSTFVTNQVTNYTTPVPVYYNTTVGTSRSTLKDTNITTVFGTTFLPAYTTYTNNTIDTVVKTGWWAVGATCYSGLFAVSPGATLQYRTYCSAYDTYRVTTLRQTYKTTNYNTLRNTFYISNRATSRNTDVYQDTVVQTLDL